jgi:hypothetical protein
MASKQPKTQKDPKLNEAKEPGHLAGTKTYQKMSIPGLPKIGLNDGPNILHIRDALIQYCQRELGPISGIFLEGRYKAPATASYDRDAIIADKSGILKDQASTRIKRAEADNDLYEKSKIKLHGILSGMTSREVDDKIAAHRDSLKRIELEDQLKTSKTSLQPSTIEVAKLETEELECPLALWKCIVHVTTTRTIGNTKVDQNNLSINFANIRQKGGETVTDFKRRMTNLLDSFDAIKLQRPEDSLIAM